MKGKVMQMLFIVVTAIFMSSVNIIADEVDMERKIRLLEICEKMGDKRALGELRKLRRTVKPQPNSRPQPQQKTLSDLRSCASV